MDYLEGAKLELDRARRELAEAEWAGDHEAVLIWRKAVDQAEGYVADTMFSSYEFG